MLDACGGWENKVEIPSDRSRYGTIDEVSEANNRVLRDIFSGPYPSHSPKENMPDPIEAVDVQNFQKLQDAYNACLNETIINELGAKPLLSILETVIAKYPVDSTCHPIKFHASYDGLNVRMDEEQCSETKDSLTEVIEYLQSIGVGALFSLIVTVRHSSTPFHLQFARRTLKTLVLILCLSIKMDPVFLAKIITLKKIRFGNMKVQYMNPLLPFSGTVTAKSSSRMQSKLLTSKKRSRIQKWILKIFKMKQKRIYSNAFHR
jgi:Peptidase family M13